LLNIDHDIVVDLRVFLRIVPAESERHGENMCD